MVGNADRLSGDNGNRCTGLCANRDGRAADPCTISLFPNFKKPPVNTQQINTAPRKSLTLLQLLGLIGAAGLIAAIVLNQFV